MNTAQRIKGLEDAMDLLREDSPRFVKDVIVAIELSIKDLKRLREKEENLELGL